MVYDRLKVVLTKGDVLDNLGGRNGHFRLKTLDFATFLQKRNKIKALRWLLGEH